MLCTVWVTCREDIFHRLHVYTTLKHKGIHTLYIYITNVICGTLCFCYTIADEPNLGGSSLLNPVLSDAGMYAEIESSPNHWPRR